MAKLLERADHERAVRRLLETRPVVMLLGPRQAGKTRLARVILRAAKPPVTTFDLEDPADLARLDDPMLALQPLRGLVVIDEVQHHPDLLPVLRVLADRPRKPARFLLLGSASFDFVRRGSETLAGRVGFHELGGFDLTEVGPANMERLWTRGGFPPAYTARSERESFEWRRDFIRTFLTRDLPQFGAAMPPNAMYRFWAMLAHWHGQIWNGSEFGRAFDISHTAVRKYLDLLSGTFMVRGLLPWHENVGKRVIKSPKIYLADSGLLHALLGIGNKRALFEHPKVGASWEGFLLASVVRRLGARDEECYFWGTHGGAELDLLVVRGSQRLGFEFKRTVAPAVTRSMHSAMADLRLERLTVIHAGRESFPLQKGVRAVAAGALLRELTPLET